MAKLRHIALSVAGSRSRPPSSSRQAFDMKRVGEARRGIYVSDGTVNVALLRQEEGETVGPLHFGMWVDDFEAAIEQMRSLRPAANAFAENRTRRSRITKRSSPIVNGMTFDVTHTGWVGAKK